MKKLLTVLTLSAALLIGMTSAHANKPLDVNCNVLEGTLVAVDAFLDGQGVQFNNLGQLVSQSKKNPVLFGQLSGLILAFSSGQINFTDAKQVVPTIAGCGQVPLLIDLINN